MKYQNKLIKVLRWNFILLVSILFAVSCNSQSGSKYTKEQKNALLDTLAANIYSSITDYTEYKREPTKDLALFTRSLLNTAKTSEYRKKGHIVNRDDIEDLVTYEVIEYNLSNEKDIQLNFVEDARGNNLQESSLQEENGKLYQNLFIAKKLNDTYSQLKGHIKIRLEIPGNIKREIDIPVNISINDVIK